MSKPRPPFARVVRLTPEGSTLSRSGGQPIAMGAEIADGEAVVLATPGGVPGAVTLDRRGVTIAIKTVALAAPAVEVVALPADPRPGAPPAQPVLAVPARGSTRQPAPVVKPISDDGPRGEERVK